MMTPSKTFNSTISVLLIVIQLSAQVLGGTRFASHVSVNTPARSFTHGVGDPLPLPARRNNDRQSSFRSLLFPLISTRGTGYQRVKPSIPFTREDISRDNTLNMAPWRHNYMDIAIPVLPPSPYKVDSPDPESLWPEGLFLPPFNPPRFGGRAASNRRSEVLSEPESLDPYLLEGSEAIAAVRRSSGHGLLYFHDIPHIESLLANQELRIKNNLKPHRIASIRHTWPYNRP